MNKIDKAMRILLAGFCINLCLGILYAWSVFNKALVSDFGWSASDASQPYAIATITFSICLLVAGVLQDRMGPRNILILGTALTGLGMIGSSFADSVLMLNITFGVITGAGIGFGYACLSPSAMKWFHSSKKGLVNGLIAAGFGLAAVYLAPVTSALISSYGINSSFMILGIGVLIIAVPLACTIDNPPAGYTPEEPKVKAGKAPVAAKKPVDISWKNMLKTPQFYSLWIMYAFAASAGLMIIGNITNIASVQANLPNAVYLASILAVFNSGGRVAAGILSDKIGGVRTLLLAFVLQGINMVLFATFTSEFTLIIGTAIAAVGYGTLLAVFPSITAEYYGLKNYGTNYGVLYTSWGIGGAIGAAVVGYSMTNGGGFGLAYTISAVMMGVCVVLALITKPISEAKAAELKTAA
ncbi:putative OXALATE:FORMATE ANTIPORTER [Vibrio nigripulchritudo SFn27]|uniref:Putative OXALATE:FORMATE ANTIPORTER n=1 Tax=Vibrio nigripulchritudo TaxID=28173 RepID=U4KDF6_9VIBR|nr:OFA family MFS transporter [Vibrio nigripulchritudo]CCN81609.1 putative OXALATE:FORMATE ANTIPORTER [Vibrio nigripulchritudo BLFn1]CCN91706.1 putative OXALATE:FORMATE ANTIPORTER [Vibrio nigripulchritudo SFn27]CCN96590.1 putative OXALATE:FORMATE ANTIPORTER [Vibrio nigripulchritudo ENn2]CCO38464.1 putative OXALATE:FORMATE ANTIPORTER [Vibrio nigripulchritudo SFn135]CCO53921.1 putative OXALATE:FORMATE ANTIPORTER [Vibrio nigripulchritudo Wn13]